VPRLPLFTVTLLSLLAAPASAQEAAKPDTLEAKLAAVTGRPEYAHSRWGMLFVDAKTGETVYAKNAEQFFCPASVTKLFSCGAAMAAFGADYRFVTPLHRRGEVKDGKLDGDLILVAQGDLTFGARRGKGGKIAFKDNDHIYTSGLTADAEVPDTDPLTAFDDLARQVKVAGITHVAGDILVDTPQHRQRPRCRQPDGRQRQRHRPDSDAGQGCRRSRLGRGATEDGVPAWRHRSANHREGQQARHARAE
jgi:D-alanyl-D-alanine carboxypeptidase